MLTRTVAWTSCSSRILRRAAKRSEAGGIIVLVTDAIGADRPIFCGTLDQIGEDALRVRQMGAAELFFDPTVSGDMTAEGYLDLMERLRKLV